MIEFLCYTCIGLCVLVIIMTLSDAQARSKLDWQQKIVDRQSRQQKRVLELIKALTSGRFVGGQVVRRIGLPPSSVFWRSQINNIQGGPDGLKVSIGWKAQLQGNKWVCTDPLDKSPLDITHLEAYVITCIDEVCVTINRGDGDVVITFLPSDSTELIDPAKVEGLKTVTAPETPEPPEPAEPTHPAAAGTTEISEEMLKIIRAVIAGGKGKLWGTLSLWNKLATYSRTRCKEFLEKLQEIGVLGSLVKHKGRECIMTPEVLQTLLDTGALKVIKTEPEPEQPEPQQQPEPPAEEPEAPATADTQQQSEPADTGSDEISDDLYKEVLTEIAEKDVYMVAQTGRDHKLSNEQNRALRDRLVAAGAIKKSDNQYLVVSEVVAKLLK